MVFIKHLRLLFFNLPTTYLPSPICDNVRLWYARNPLLTRIIEMNEFQEPIESPRF